MRREPPRKYTLYEIRKAATSLSQAAVGAVMWSGHQRISKMETGHPKSLTVRSLDSYAQALGGELRVVIVFPDGNFYHVEVDRKG